MSTDTAAPCLLDVVVFAGGESLELMPLTAVEPKTMLRICNRPLIWYCITPWIEAGFRTFFLCVNEDYATLRAYLSRAFDGVDFHYVLVPSTIGENTSTTCDAVKAYLRYKEALRRGEEGSLMGDNMSSVVVDREDSITGADGGGGGRSPLHEAPAQRRHSSSGAAAGGATSASHHHSNRDPLRLERMNSAGLPRDAVLLSCDTILVDVDVASFVEKHYASLASVTAMLYRPLQQRERAAGAAAAGGGERKGGARGKGAAAAAAAAEEAPQAAFKHGVSCVAYEEQDALAAMTLGSPSSAPAASHSRRHPGAHAGASVGLRSPRDARPAGAAGDATHAYPHQNQHQHHHRMHYLAPLDADPVVRITTAFAARRPDLTFTADVVDAHAYLVRRWVLDFIAQSAGNPETTVRKGIVPLLARSQHTTVNAAEKAFVTPSDKLNTTVPLHWLNEGAEVSVQSLNAAPGAALPPVTDSLRVFCTILEEDPDAACRIYRVNTLDNYRALHQEMMSAKCHQPQLQDVTGAGANVRGGGGNRVALPLLLPHGSHGDGGKPAPSAGALALAALLPDNPITVREKIGDQQVYIVNSFIDTVPPPNVFVTRSVIGAHVTLAPKARITDSILMGNVEIGAQTVVSNSVIGAGSVISAKCRVTDTVVAPRCVVEEDVSDTIVE